MFVSFFPSHVGGAGDGQRCIGNAEKASTRTDGERNPGFFGSSIPPHSLRAFRDLAVLVSGHGILLRRGLALTQTKTKWQMLHRYGSQVSSPSTSSLPLLLSTKLSLVHTPKFMSKTRKTRSAHRPRLLAHSLARSFARASVFSLSIALSSECALSLSLFLSGSCPVQRQGDKRKAPKKGNSLSHDFLSFSECFLSFPFHD